MAKDHAKFQEVCHGQTVIGLYLPNSRAHTHTYLKWCPLLRMKMFTMYRISTKIIIVLGLFLDKEVNGFIISVINCNL